MWRAAAVGLVGVLAAGVAGWGSAAPEFVSKRYAYRFAPGEGYYAKFASTQWRGDFPRGTEPGVEAFLDWNDRKFIVAALRIPASMTLPLWKANHVARMQTQCNRAHAFRNSTLGGAPAKEFLSVCPEYDVIVLTAIHASRGYIFQFVSPTANSDAADRRAYEVGRRTFRFTP